MRLLRSCRELKSRGTLPLSLLGHDSGGSKQRFESFGRRLCTPNPDANALRRISGPMLREARKNERWNGWIEAEAEVWRFCPAPNVVYGRHTFEGRAIRR